MTEQLTTIAQQVVGALERTDVEAVRPELADRLIDWDPLPWILDRWRPRLDELAGPRRQVTSARPVNDVMARVTLTGDRGTAYVSVLFDNVEKVAGLAIDDNERDGQFWLVISCREEQEAMLRDFYEALTVGRLGFGEGGARPPRWGDPNRPPQIHLDITVADLARAEHRVLDLGATKLAEFSGWRVYADPVGHPFCLYPGLDEPTAPVGALQRIVLDCSDPTPLARFWADMLGMPRRVESSPDRVVIAGDVAGDPMIACQRVENYRSPRWPDPRFPAQMHFDLGFDDRSFKERRAVELGASMLPPQGGSCPVYSDPAGHPFCLCYKGE